VRDADEAIEAAPVVEATPRRGIGKRVATAVLLLLLLAAAWWLFGDRFAVDDLAAHEERLRTAVAERPWRSFAVGLAIYVVVSLVPGTTGKALVAAWIFGFWQGLVIVNVGLTIAALASFFASRFVIGDLVAARAGPRIERVNAVLEREGAGYLFVARILHAPYSITNYVMGATRIRTTSFWWATQLGLLPGNLLYVYAGAQAPAITEVAERGIGAILTPGLAAAFVVVTVMPLGVRALARWMVASGRRRAARVRKAAQGG